MASGKSLDIGISLDPEGKTTSARRYRVAIK
jgi:hypothetical protein